MYTILKIYHCLSKLFSGKLTFLNRDTHISWCPFSPQVNIVLRLSCQNTKYISQKVLQLPVQQKCIIQNWISYYCTYKIKWIQDVEFSKVFVLYTQVIKKKVIKMSSLPLKFFVRMNVQWLAIVTLYMDLPVYCK